MYRPVASLPSHLPSRLSACVRDAELSVLEALGGGDSVGEALEKLIEHMESHMDGALGSVCLLDGSGTRIGLGAAPSLPEAQALLTNLKVGPNQGSCGTAAFTGELTVVEDIATDPLWDAHRDVALGAGLRACWSCPILEGPGRVLGTFAFYYRTPRAPSADDLAVVEAASAIARVAIQLSRTRETLTLLSTAISRLNDMVLIADAGDPSDGPRTVFINEAFERVTGFTLADVVGRRPSFLDDEASPRQSVETLIEALSGHTAARVELMLKTRSGSPYWVEADFAPVHAPSGKLTHFVCIQRDITERKRSEASLRDREHLLAAVLSNLPGMAYRARFGNGAWDLEFASAGCLALTGRSLTTIQASGPRNFAGLVHPDDLGVLEDTLSAALRRTEPYEVSYRITTSEGLERWVWDRGAALSTGGSGEGMIEGFITDVTERKILEEQIVHAQRLEGIGTLAGGIAHDLNNILAPIVLTADLLKDRLGDPEATILLNNAAESARKGASLVRQVLLFARGADGRRRPLSTEGLIRQLGPVLEGIMPKDIRIEISARPGLPAVKGDPAQLHQVMLNLCVNARDAMPAGGTLRIAAEGMQVATSATRPHPDATAGDYVRIDFFDTGNGIPEHHRSRVFDPFFTTKEVGKGKGLGLSTARAIIKSHGGFMTLRSAPGIGSTFSVYLPGTDEAPEAHAEEARQGQGAPPRGSGQRILVVDNEDTVRLIARATLERFGYLVATACDGVQAAGLLANPYERVDLALVDLQMPGIDVLATISALRALRPRLPIVCTSGSGSRRARRGLEEAGVRHLLDKPFSVETLVRTVSTALAEPAAP